MIYAAVLAIVGGVAILRDIPQIGAFFIGLGIIVFVAALRHIRRGL